MLSDEEAAVLRALRRCSVQRYARDASFIESLRFDQELTERQRAYLLSLRWKYRRQIDAGVPLALEALVQYRAQHQAWAKAGASRGVETVEARDAGTPPGKPADDRQASFL